MKTIILALAVLSLAGCGNVMTNDEIIAEVKKCERAGLRASAVYSFTYSKIKRVICEP